VDNIAFRASLADMRLADALVVTFVVLAWCGLVLGSITRPSGRPKSRRMSSEDEASVFDRFGSLEHMTNVYRAVERASPIVVFRSERANSTVVGYVRRKPDLLSPVGVEEVTSLVTPWQKLFITGMSSDVRVVTHLARRLALEHTFDFDGPASTWALAEQVGRVLREQSMSPGRRPFAVTVVLVDSAEKRILQIDASGEVLSVVGAVAGIGRHRGEARLLNGLEALGADADADADADVGAGVVMEIDERDVAKDILRGMLGWENQRGSEKEEGKEDDDDHDDVLVTLILPDVDLS